MKSQIEKVLPRIAWDSVEVKENGEPLVEVAESENLKIGLIKKQYQSSFFVRKTIAEKLKRVSEHLPKGMRLVLIEGYRTLKHQQESWDRKFAKLKEENPTWTNEEIEAKVRLVVAKPHPLANHHCGGAIDVTLAYADGKLVDMGNPYPSEALGMETQKKFPMFPNIDSLNLITKEQGENRSILRGAMEKEDFVWYPGEWWHYCYGDRMWAVYTNQNTCVYGPIELE